MDNLDRLKVVKTEYIDCRKCGLCNYREKMVWGYGNPESKVMIVVDGPNKFDDHYGIPVAGPASEILNTMLNQVKSSREEVWITPVTLCRALADDGEERVPTKEEMLACQKRLHAEITIIDPNIIIILGEIPMRALVKGQKPKIGKSCGKLLPIEVPVGEDLPPATYRGMILFSPEQLMKMDAAWTSNGIARKCTDHLRDAFHISDFIEDLRRDPDRALSANPGLRDRGEYVTELGEL
jgi:uracil-DNA glycosylase family 4